MVFNDEKHEPGNEYIVVECKKKTLTAGEKQLGNYLSFCAARMGVWYNGQERLFLFHHYSQSNRDWDKAHRSWDDRPDWTDTTINNGNDCHLVDADAYFNTSNTFTQCGHDCDEGDDEWDAKHVAAHEFAHWFSLTDTHRPWHLSCISFPKHNTDYSVCNHERGEIQDIYGEED